MQCHKEGTVSKNLIKLVRFSQHVFDPDNAQRGTDGGQDRKESTQEVQGGADMKFQDCHGRSLLLCCCCCCCPWRCCRDGGGGGSIGEKLLSLFFQDPAGLLQIIPGLILEILVSTLYPRNDDFEDIDLTELG